MFKKLISVTFFALALSVALTNAATAAETGLEGWWKFDGDGLDSSGNNHNGTFMNGAGLATGYFGQALYLDGSGAYFNVDGYKGIVGDGTNTPPFSIVVWIKKEGPVGGDGEIVGWGSTGAGNRMEFRFNAGNNRVRIECGGGNAQNDTELITGQWQHVAMTVGENSTYASGVRFYLDGVDDTRPNTDPDPIHPIENFDVKIGAGYNLDNRFYTGYIDDVRIYDRVLTATEVGDIMELGYLASAHSPSPPDGSQYTDTWVNLQWTAGNLSVSHDLYFGTTYDDISTGSKSAFIGNMTSTMQPIGFPGFPYPEGLVAGTTYYWRVDEVNDAHPDSPWRGKVWSFSVPFKAGYNPDPVNGAQFESTGVDLNWQPGMNAIMHAVYFGTNADEIANATGAPVQMRIGFDPGPLGNETTYYWRVDTFNGAEWIKGPLWSFKTMPVISMTDDPMLAAWWKLDEDPGTTVVDWSGYGHHGRFTFGQAQWIQGIDGDALEFPGGWVEMTEYEGVLGKQNRTVAAWIRTTGYGDYISWGQNVNTQKWICRVQDGAADGTVGALRTECSGGYIIGSTVLTDGQWHHVTSVLESSGAPTISDIRLYVDGREEVISGWQAIDVNTVGGGRTVWLGEGHHSRLFPGQLDDVRIYERALTEDEIKLLMRGDLSLAWDPEPRTGQEVDLDNALPLRWKAGDKASQHDVYFGLEKDTIENADTSDTSGVYRGRQSVTSYTPPEGVEWSGGPYYWRVDEYNTDGTISKGRVWVFTVVDFILVDDFESYSDNDADGEAIWQHWIDGFGVPGNGAQVGDLMPPYAEQTIVHSGLQSMPLLYNNTSGITNSEAVLTLTAPRDWTRHGLASLSLWFRGYPGSVGSFVEAPAGTYTMTASGADIGGATDRFHYAFKTLTGAGSIVARINSIQNTNAWAKAGVMIRETLDAGSKYTFACVTPGNGVFFQGRTEVDTAGFSTNQTGITAPHWVKLERDVAGNFTVSHSANGSAWESVANSIPTNISMNSNVYIGLALTSHDIVLTGEAVFSNVTMTGSVSGQWAHQDIGISSNAAEPMYVALSNVNGTSAIVAHENPTAATIEEWTEWVILLQAFADQGVNLADVDSIAIGLGTKAGVAASGGSGKMYFDDIRLYPPAREPEPLP